MKTTLASLSLAALFTNLSLAEEKAPEFPKIGVEYRLALPTLKNGAVRLDNISTNVVFLRWIEGTWYEVACSGDGSDGTFRTNMNVAHVFTMAEAEEKWVTEKLKAGSGKPKADAEKPKAEAEKH